MKLKNIIIGIGFIGVLLSCTSPHSEYNEKTYAGYVASDYTLTHLKRYGNMLEYIYRFNEYYLQPTPSKRDSIDKLYFKDIKLRQSKDGHTWTLHHLSYPNNEFLSIQTNGHPLNTPDAVWTIRDLSTPKSASKMGIFEVKNKADGTWIIEQHHNRDRDSIFDITGSWTVRFNNDKAHGILTGNGRLLSIQQPQLQLDYTIEAPLQMNYIDKDYLLSFTDGEIKILATDVRLNKTEEIKTSILEEDKMTIHYKDYNENWWYSMRISHQASIHIPPF